MNSIENLGTISTFSTKDNIYLTAFLAKGKRRSDSVIVYIPGLYASFLTDNLFWFTAQAYAKRGVDLLYVNTRGAEVITSFNKKKGKVPFYQWVTFGTALERFEDCLKDIRAAIDYAQSLGYKKIFLAGHSSGCQKATYYMGKTGDKRVKALVLLSPGDDYNISKCEGLGKKFRQAVKLAKLSPGEFVPKWVNKTQMSGARFLSFADPKNAEAQLFNYEGKLALFSRIRCPILAVFGDKDKYLLKTPEEYFVILRKHAKATRFDSLVIQNAPHGFDGKEGKLAGIVCKWAKAC